MRSIPPTLEAKLAAGTTTLCRCWRVERRDGAAFGFTDHDRDLAFDGLAYRARGGFDVAEIERELGLTVDSASAFGALNDAAITEADLEAGLWDEARVTIFRVDWSAPEDRFTEWRGEFGEIRRGPLAFEAELRAPSHRLNQTTGRVYQRRCDADVGDARCGVDLDTPQFSAAGSVAVVLDARAFESGDLGVFESGWFARGRCGFESGSNAGRSFEVESHDGARVTLRAAPPAAIAAGDGFTLTAGCDKRFSTCRDKFANTLNFRGFPHMPGNDVLMAGPRADETSDGGSRGLGD